MLHDYSAMLFLNLSW